MSDPDPIVLPNDVVQAGFCGSGLKHWCKDRGLDMKRLFKHEVRLSEVEAMDDAFAVRVAAAVRARVENAS